MKSHLDDPHERKNVYLGALTLALGMDSDLFSEQSHAVESESNFHDSEISKLLRRHQYLHQVYLDNEMEEEDLSNSVVQNLNPEENM
jgi:hypothetical protein